MREVTYYRLAATLPVVIPFIAHLFYRDDPTIGLIDRVTTLLYVSGIAWPAYIPFAAALFWWLDGQPLARYRRVSWLTPVLFLPPFLAYLLLVRWWTASTEPWVEALIFYSILVLLFGYGYVLLTHLGRRMLAWRGRALAA
jgi:hypothetical protein